MDIKYEVIPEKDVYLVKDLCNGLMAYQKSVARIHPEFFGEMWFETRMLPSLKSARHNYIVIAKDKDEVIAYAYSNIAPKYIYSSGFATLNCEAFFDFDSVKSEDVGCLSQIFIKEGYRNMGIGSVLFDMSMEWMNSFDNICFYLIISADKKLVKEM
ncbi:GNAT family N-acetyltransferase [Thermovenabulum sp.]|uniref:GNAT family N-acetyltransferase n=1 Tax=Thermovenabulum sp. TaxID=3100335 RepID=UPI003C7DFE20